MKKTVLSFSLLALLLYNAFGYYVLFAYEQQQVRSLCVSQLSDSDFTITKMPATLYMHVEDSDFEYVNTEVKMGDKVFNIVKQRVLRDTLYMYSLRNFKSEDLTGKLNDIVVSQTIEKQTSNYPSPIKNLLKSFIKDYLPNHEIRICLNNVTPKNDYEKIISNVSGLISVTLSVCSPPPKFV